MSPIYWFTLIAGRCGFCGAMRMAWVNSNGTTRCVSCAPAVTR